MFLNSKPWPVKIAAFSLLATVVLVLFVYKSRSNGPVAEVEVSTGPAARPAAKPNHVKGIHLTAWYAGSKKMRERIRPLLEETELNTVVIAVKEYKGEVYIPGVPLAHQQKLYVNAIPDVREYLAELKKRGIYTIARIVVFKDGALARKRPDLAVLWPDGRVWTDHAGNAWADPYNKQVWDYNLSVATVAVDLGFDEIQFDYIRYPSDGQTKLCRYSYAQHNSSSAARSLDGFLAEAARRIKPLGARVSIDIFGLTPSVQHDMGIGQKIMQMTQWVDYVSPMVYPSHYARGEYGIANPNSEPYKVVHKTLSDGKRRMGEDFSRLRPYLQDFSLGYKYGPKEVRAQIQACEDVGIHEWLLWNAACNYTRLALKTKDGVLPEEARLPKSMMVKLESKEPKISSGTASSPAGEKKKNPEPQKMEEVPGKK